MIRINRRVAPLKSGKANGVDPNLGIAINRLNSEAVRCHEMAAKLVRNCGQAAMACSVWEGFVVESPQFGF